MRTFTLALFKREDGEVVCCGYCDLYHYQIHKIYNTNIFCDAAWAIHTKKDLKPSAACPMINFIDTEPNELNFIQRTFEVTVNVLDKLEKSKWEKVKKRNTDKDRYTTIPNDDYERLLHIENLWEEYQLQELYKSRLTPSSMPVPEEKEDGGNEK